MQALLQQQIAKNGEKKSTESQVSSEFLSLEPNVDCRSIFSKSVTVLATSGKFGNVLEKKMLNLKYPRRSRGL